MITNLHLPKSVFILLILFSLNSKAQVPTTKAGTTTSLLVSNICENYALLTICNGSDSLNESPSLGTVNCYSPIVYMHYDSLLNFNEVKHIAYEEYGMHYTYPVKFCIASDSEVLTYEISYPSYDCNLPLISPRDTLQIDSTAGMIFNQGKVIFIRNTLAANNLIIYDTLLSAIIFSSQLNIDPKFISGTYSYFAVVGVNQNNETELMIYNSSNFAIIKDTVFSSFCDKPVNMSLYGQNLLLASQPGDSIINVLQYNFITGITAFSTVYHGSGIHVSAWLYNDFHFQPQSDNTGNGFEKQVFTFTFWNMQLSGPYNINRRLRILDRDNSSSGGFFYMNAVEEGGSENILLRYIISNYQLYDTVITGLNPSFFIPDYRCPYTSTDYDDSKVEWKIFPNPSDNSMNLHAVGLICGRDYKIDIIDSNGKIKYQTTIHSKMTFILPTKNFSQGIYYVRIYTRKGLVIQKIIKT